MVLPLAWRQTRFTPMAGSVPRGLKVGDHKRVWREMQRDELQGRQISATTSDTRARHLSWLTPSASCPTSALYGFSTGSASRVYGFSTEMPAKARKHRQRPTPIPVFSGVFARL